MYAELRSPNIHEPLNMAEYNNTILSYRDVTPVLWAGGTEIMSRPDYYPSQKANVELISKPMSSSFHWTRSRSCITSSETTALRNSAQW